MRGREAKAVLSLLAILALVLTFTFIEYAPTTTDYSIYNYGWNGLSKITELGSKILTDYESLSDLGNDTAILLIPQKELSRDEIEALTEYLLRGGLVIVADDTGIINDALNKLIGGIRITNLTVLDPAFKYRSQLIPKINITIDNTSLVAYANVPSSLDIISDAWVVIGTSSKFSYLDLNNNLTKEIEEPQGPFPIIAYASCGSGKIFVIADSDIFINSMMELGNNLLLKLIVSNRTLFLDVSHLRLSPLDRVKLGIFTVKEKVHELTLVTILVALSVVASLVQTPWVGRPKPVLYFSSLYIAAFAALYAFLSKTPTSLVFTLTPLLVMAGNTRLSTSLIAVTILYLGRDPLFLMSMLPMIALYPLNFNPTLRVGDLREFLGTAAQNVVKVIVVLIPSILLSPTSLLAYILIAFSLITWCLGKYLELGKVSIEPPREDVIAIVGKRISIDFGIRSKTPIRIYVLTKGYVKVHEVQGETLLTVPYTSVRLGYQDLLVSVVTEDLDGLAVRRFRYVIKVNVVPSVKVAIKIVETGLKGIIEVIGGPLGGAYSGRTLKAGRGGTGFGIRGAGLGGEVGAEVIRGVRYVRIHPRAQLKKRRGEYFGTRYYVPGDDIKMIHWKKSASKGELVVKEFVVGGVSGGGGGAGGLVMFIDLIASSPEELDRLAYTSLATLVKKAVTGPEDEVVTFFVLPNDRLEIIHGRAIDVLAAIVNMFKKRNIYTEFNYISMGKALSHEKLVKLMEMDISLVKAAKKVSEKFTNRILGILSTLRINSPVTFTIINGKPTAFRYSYLKYKLSELGHQYVAPKVLTLQELREATQRLLTVMAY